MKAPHWSLDQLPPHLQEQAQKLLAEHPTPQISDAGNVQSLTDAELWDRVAAEDVIIKNIEAVIKTKSKQATTARYRRGLFLAELKRRCKYGEFGKECAKRRVRPQRAGEDQKIAEYFSQHGGEEAAAKVTVRRAIKLAYKIATPEDDDFRTPPWFFQRLDSRYHFTLDAFASKDNALCRVFITAKQDARRQNWKKWSKGGAVFCNSPFSIIGEAVVKGHAEAQSGILVCMVVPLWQSQDWFKEIVCRYGELFFVGKKVSYKGGGCKEGAIAGQGIGGVNSMETMVVVFRKDQLVSFGGFIVGSYAEEAANNPPIPDWLEKIDFFSETATSPTRPQPKKLITPSPKMSLPSPKTITRPSFGKAW
jgi:phage N-6-adenine-methyltransferase